MYCGNLLQAYRSIEILSLISSVFDIRNTMCVLLLRQCNCYFWLLLVTFLAVVYDHFSPQLALQCTLKHYKCLFYIFS